MSEGIDLKMDITSIFGILIGLITIILAQLLESGSVSAIIQPTAALIVLGGTFGAVCLNFSSSSMFSAFASIKKIFITEKDNIMDLINQIIQLSTISRQGSILALDGVIHNIDSEFLRKGARLCIDVNNSQLLQEILMTKIGMDEEETLESIKVFEAIGGFTPVFGIIGAVLGLIHVMGNLQDPAQLGHGIATAFVATIYGVGLANLIFLPIAGKLKSKLKKETIIKEMMVQGLISIHAGENPLILEEKLLAFANLTNKQNYFMTDLSQEQELG